MPVGAIASIGSSVIGGLSASKAGKAQRNAARDQLALEERVYEETKGRFAPIYDNALNYQSVLDYELGIGERPTFGGQAPTIEAFTVGGNQASSGWQRDVGDPGGSAGSGGTSGGRYGGTPATTKYRVNGNIFDTHEAAQAYANDNRTGGREYGGFRMTPGHKFELSQGLGAIDSSAASNGTLFSGATMKAAQGYGQGLADQKYGNYLNRITGQADKAIPAAAHMANAGANYASGAGNALANYGNAGAAQAIGVGNAIQGGFQDLAGFGGGGGIFGFQS